MDTLTQTEKKIFHSLNTPKKIQDFLNTLAPHPGPTEPIVRSPRLVLKTRTATCMEGALFAAAAMLMHGERPYLLDLKVGTDNDDDVDHVVTVFKKDGHFGAFSKTRHAVLRYREPIYKTLRELALSYFHEYFIDDGKKTLRSFSKPFDIKKVFGTEWITDAGDLYEIACALDDSPHISFLTKKMVRNLRPADPIEIEAGKLIEGS